MASRREFLKKSGGAGIGAIAGTLAPAALRAQDNLPPNVPQWMKEQGEPVNWRPYGLPAAFEKQVTKFKRPSVMPTEGVSLTPLQHLHGIITPSGLVFERQHGGVPLIDPAQHRLLLHGMVKRPLVFTMDEVVRFPSQSHIYFVECSGNTSRDYDLAGRINVRNLSDTTCDFRQCSVQVGNDNIFGFQVTTDFDIYNLLGRYPPPGADWTASADYFSKRGPALGTNYKYGGTDLFGFPGRYTGNVKLWGIFDHGTDQAGQTGGGVHA